MDGGTMSEDKKSFDEMVIAYEMGGRDKQLANIAQLIVGAYNGEQKPPVIPKEKEIAPPYYRWKHSTKGYSLLSSETEDFATASILVTDEHIYDFVEHVFLVLAGDTTVKWNKVYTSKAVLLALEKYFGMKVDLSNIGPEHETEGIFGTPKLPIRPTIWVEHNIQVDDYKRDILLREGFKCYKHDKEMWGLVL